jgi:hypothetical protein
VLVERQVPVYAAIPPTRLPTFDPATAAVTIEQVTPYAARAVVTPPASPRLVVQLVAVADGWRVEALDEAEV